jgi:hypothetical protein
MKISEEYLAYNVKDAMFGGCGTIVREGCLFIIFWRIHRCPEGGLSESQVPTRYLARCHSLLHSPLRQVHSAHVTY